MRKETTMAAGYEPPSMSLLLPVKKEVERMTPIKQIILFGVMVLVEDTAGGIELKATCPNERDASWLAGCLVEYHKVPLEHLTGPGATQVVFAGLAR